MQCVAIMPLNMLQYMQNNCNNAKYVAPKYFAICLKAPSPVGVSRAVLACIFVGDCSIPLFNNKSSIGDLISNIYTDVYIKTEKAPSLSLVRLIHMYPYSNIKTEKAPSPSGV